MPLKLELPANFKLYRYVTAMLVCHMVQSTSVSECRFQPGMLTSRVEPRDCTFREHSPATEATSSVAVSLESSISCV